MQMPAKMPTSNGKTKHATKAAMPGIKSVSVFKEKIEQQFLMLIKNSKEKIDESKKKCSYSCCATLA